MTQPVPDVAAYWSARATRHTLEELDAMEMTTPTGPEFGVTPPGQRGARAGGPGAPGAPVAAGRGAFAQGGFNRNDFFRSEGAIGTLTTAPRGHGIHTIGGNRAADPATTLPAVAIPAEQYGRMARMLAKDVPVTIEAEIKNTFVPDPLMFNIVAEIPGTDKADEVVVLGAHFDSWHASTGATDNAAGTAAMMEAMRILEDSGLELRRTVRLGLWTGEEQGLIGSREYVSAHYASRGTPPAPDHAKFAAYFNIDNNTGAIRGVYLQGNQAVAPIFREWMEPFRSLGMTHLTIRNTGGTDHQSFDAVGLPGFQFIQDEVEYDTVAHHTNLDGYERLQPSDMMKNATIAAGFAYLAANRDDKLPRKPLPAAAAGRRGSQQ